MSDTAEEIQRMSKDPAHRQYSEAVQRIGRMQRFDSDRELTHEDYAAALRIVAMWHAEPATALAFPATTISAGYVREIAQKALDWTNR